MFVHIFIQSVTTVPFLRCLVVIHSCLQGHEWIQSLMRRYTQCFYQWTINFWYLLLLCNLKMLSFELSKLFYNYANNILMMSYLNVTILLNEELLFIEVLSRSACCSAKALHYQMWKCSYNSEMVFQSLLNFDKCKYFHDCEYLIWV
jgi:hypothetical protein